VPVSLALGALDPYAAGILRPLACDRLQDESEPAPRAEATATALLATSPDARARVVEDAYRRHHGLVYRVALRYGRGDASWAEDVAHDVFMDLHVALPRLDELESLEGWLYRATTNRCLNRLRRERFLALPPVRWLLAERQPEARQPDALVIVRDDLRRAFDALEALPPKERVAFSMYHLDDRGQDEIARVLGHTKGYVCKLIQRAESRLREEGWEFEHG
jgi:RNA polymerase sigma-70 factor (ECF subfamily)